MKKIRASLLLRIAAVIMLLHSIGHIVGASGWQNPNGKVPADVVQKMQNTHFNIKGADTTMAMSFSGMSYMASIFLLLITAVLWMSSTRTGREGSGILLMIAAATACLAVVEFIFFFPGVAFLSLAATLLISLSIYKLNRTVNGSNH